MTACCVHQNGSWRSGVRVRRSSRARQPSGGSARGAPRPTLRLEDVWTVIMRTQTLIARMPSAQSRCRNITVVSSDRTLPDT